MKLEGIGSYIKTITLSLLLGLETFVLGQFITGFVEKQNFFGIDMGYSAIIIGMMLLILITFSLTVGGWNNWIQYLMIPLPIGIAIVATTIRFNIVHAFVAGLIATFSLVYDVWVSTRIKDLLIRFDPKMILKFSTRGILFVFSLFAGLMVILQTTYPGKQINIGALVADNVKGPVESIVQRQINTTIGSNLENEQLMMERAQLKEDLKDIDPQVREALVQQGFGPMLDQIENDEEPEMPADLIPDINYEELITEQVNTLLEPYKEFIRPVMAILVFGLFQLYAFITSIIFIVTIDLVYILAKKTGFFKVIKIPVEKEELKF